MNPQDREQLPRLLHIEGQVGSTQFQAAALRDQLGRGNVEVGARSDRDAQIGCRCKQEPSKCLDRRWTGEVLDFIQHEKDGACPVQSLKQRRDELQPARVPKEPPGHEAGRHGAGPPDESPAPG